MTEISKDRILAGRKAVIAYGKSHTILYSVKWHKGIPEEHTPLLNKLLEDLKVQGFGSLSEFYKASEDYNVEVFGVRSTDASPEKLQEIECGYLNIKT